MRNKLYLKSSETINPKRVVDKMYHIRYTEFEKMLIEAYRMGQINYMLGHIHIKQDKYKQWVVSIDLDKLEWEEPKGDD